MTNALRTGRSGLAVLLFALLAGCAGGGAPGEEGAAADPAREASDFFRRLGTPPDEYRLKVEPPPLGPLKTGRGAD